MEELNQAFRHLRKEFFPMWDRRTRWTALRVPKNPDWNGWCNKKTKTIKVGQHVTGLDLQETLVHEICHALTTNGHCDAWRNRMLKAVELAETKGLNDLRKLISEDVEQFGPDLNPRQLREMAYNRIRDCVRAKPEWTFEQVIEHTWSYYSTSLKTFLESHKQARKVFEQELQEIQELRKLREELLLKKR